MRHLLHLSLAVAALASPLAVRAGTAHIPIAADTFINSAAPNANAGATAWIDAGTDGGNLGAPGVRRALLRFDLSTIPPGSTVTSAVLRLVMTKVPGFGQAVDSTMALHRMNAAWTEGVKVGPNGAPATAGESTWNFRTHNTTPWTAAGALPDAASTPSASVAVGSTDNTTYNWGGQGLVQDVQAWLDNPGQNFGWMLKSTSEGTARTARGFGSREAGSDAGMLEVGYTEPVVTSNAAPIVFISNPTNDAAFTTPSVLNLTATATDPDGSITNVQFFRGTNLLGTASGAGFSLSLTLYPGSYEVNAVATDNRGSSTTSSNITFSVSSVAITNPIAERIPKGDITVELRTAADGMASPVTMVVPDDGSGRMFVADQNGVVHVVTAAGRSHTPLLDIRSRLVLLGAYDERGLLGLALHPGFRTNQLLYTYTSEPVNGTADFQTGLGTNNHQSVVAEWRVSTGDSNAVDVASRREILRIDQPQANHNGGAMHFGPDGLLYITLGDGGGANDVGPGHVPGGNAQDLDRIWGKLVRIDVNGTNSANGKYGIPASNAFVGTNGLDEVYAYGLRNPFTFSFDRQTGLLYLADVGQNRVEEINIITNGGNYGWNIREASFWFDPAAGAVVTAPVRPPPANMIDPIAQYDHDDGLAIIGGYVYRGTAIPALSGRYVFGDWGAFGAPSGRLYYLDNTNGVKEFRIGLDDRQLGQWIKGFGEGPDGELYVLTTRWLGPSGDTGKLLKLVPSGSQVAISGIEHIGDSNVVVSWTGGDGPFALQKKTRLSETTWKNEVVVNRPNAAVPADGPSGFFRVHEAGHLPKIPFTVYLSGSAERPPNSSPGSGMGILVLDGNSLSFNIRYSNLSGEARSGHIHGPVDTTTNALVLIDLAPYNGGAWGSNGTLSGVVQLTDLQKSHLLAGLTYVNLHTPSFPGGEIRGQIAPVNFQVELNAANVGSNVQSSGVGFGNVTLVGNELTLNMTYRGLTAAPLMAQLRGPANPNQTGDVLAEIPMLGGVAPGTSGVLGGRIPLTFDQLSWVIDGMTYISIHTPTNQGGEIRGQLIPQSTGVPFTTVLSGLAERPTPLTNGAFGNATLSLEGNWLSFNVAYQGLSGTAIGAHIHGPSGTGSTAPVMVNLEPFHTGPLSTNGSFAGMVHLTTAQRDAVLNGQTYINVHTPLNQGGEIRGQIAPVAMTASLSGNNERPAPAATPGMGSGTFALVHDGLNAAVTYSQLLSSANAAHIHGPASFTGSANVLRDLSGIVSGGFGVAGSLNGTVQLPVPALLNVIDGQTYVNFHTTNYPGGEIRGHILR